MCLIVDANVASLVFSPEPEADFAPIWDAATEIDVWGPPSAVRSLQQRIARYFSPPLFPMQLSDVRARVSFHDVMTDQWQIGGAWVSSDLVSHPGPTLGFRLEERGRALAYIPDHEPKLGGGLRELTPDWISGAYCGSLLSCCVRTPTMTSETATSTAHTATEAQVRALRGA